MLEQILDLHFSKDTGSPYWLDTLKKQGMKRGDFRTMADLYHLGPMDVGALRNRPIADFIPVALHHRMAEMILAETGGTTGEPCRRVYLPEEFHDAFVAPWLLAVERFRFPQKQNWLFVGPSGPHVIAQAARAFARATMSLEPFSIDCDVRWIRRQQPESMGHRLYKDHLMEQALNIIRQQNITVIFTTPPLLLALAEAMTVTERQRIAGIHTGGMAQSTEVSNRLAVLFPDAVILPGYGNSLFGVAFEIEQTENRNSVFFVQDPALCLQLIPLPEHDCELPRLAEVVAAGERGRVMFHRFDRSFLLLNMLERDTAIRIVQNETQGLADIAEFNLARNKSGGVY